MTEKTELSEVEELEQHRVGSKAEIARVLATLSKSVDLITAYIDDNNYLLTSVVAVLPDRDLLVLDYGPTETQNSKLLEKGRAVCVTRHQSVSIKFICNGIQRARLKGNPVFAAPIPEVMYRLQRREFFRVNTPLATPISCIIPADDGRPWELQVTNLSVGGIGLQDNDLDHEWERGRVFEGCSIDLPGHGMVAADLEVRNIFPHTQPDGSTVMRIGCAFKNLPADRSALVQRYINKLQIEQRR